MGRILFLVSLLLGEAGLTFGQNLYGQYHPDAVQLVARTAALANESAELSTNLMAELSMAIEAIERNSSDVAWMVTQELQIHAYPTANTKSLDIYVDESTEWLANLSTNNLHNPLRSFFIAHELKVVSKINIDGIVKLSIESRDPQNMRFIANKISFLEDVFMVEVPAPSGDGHDIEAKRVQNGWMISYIYKYENCPSGCKKSYSWKFGVNDSGEVTYLGAYGEVPPALSNGPASSVVLKVTPE